MNYKYRFVRGQAMVEYIVVVGLAVLGMYLASTNRQGVKEIMDAIVGFFKAYSYVLSVSAQDSI